MIFLLKKVLVSKVSQILTFLKKQIRQTLKSSTNVNGFKPIKIKKKNKIKKKIKIKIKKKIKKEIEKEKKIIN